MVRYAPRSVIGIGETSLPSAPIERTVFAAKLFLRGVISRPRSSRPVITWMPAFVNWRRLAAQENSSARQEPVVLEFVSQADQVAHRSAKHHVLIDILAVFCLLPWQHLEVADARACPKIAG